MDRFWSKVNKNTPNGCWEWTAGKRGGGYGRFRIGPRDHQAHRVAWELENGQIPEGLFVLHSCDNRACVRPSHLFLGTNSDNMIDAYKKGRINPQPPVLQREDHPRAHLSTDEVEEIRLRYAGGHVTQQELSTEFGVSQAHISKIVRGQLWAP